MHSLFNNKSLDTPLLSVVKPMFSQNQGRSSGILFNYQKQSENPLFLTDEPPYQGCLILGKST